MAEAVCARGGVAEAIVVLEHERLLLLEVLVIVLLEHKTQKHTNGVAQRDGGGERLGGGHLRCAAEEKLVRRIGDVLYKAPELLLSVLVSHTKLYARADSFYVVH